MGLRINETAPDFTAETTQGTIHFHDWIGDGWAVLFSHPKNFTPVCTTELGTMAGLAGEFAKRNAKVIGISVDPVGSHAKWKDDIKTATGHSVEYPLIGDRDLKVAKLYDMLPADAGETSEGRTPADNATVRSVFVIGAGQEDQADPDLSDDDRPQLPGDPARHRFDPAHRQAPGGDAGRLEAGRGRDHHRRRLQRGCHQALRRVRDDPALSPQDQAAERRKSGRASSGRRSKTIVGSPW